MKSSGKQQHMNVKICSRCTLIYMYRSLSRSPFTRTRSVFTGPYFFFVLHTHKMRISAASWIIIQDRCYITVYIIMLSNYCEKPIQTNGRVLTMMTGKHGNHKAQQKLWHRLLKHSAFTVTLKCDTYILYMSIIYHGSSLAHHNSAQREGNH